MKNLILTLALLGATLHAQSIMILASNAGSSGGGTVATPTDSPGAGTYGSTQSVTLSDSTGSAAICYTTDSSTPLAATAGTCSHGTTYSTSISVSSTTTIKAIGTKSGMTNSGVLTSVYTITGFTSFVTGETAGTPRNNADICAGYSFTVSGSNITVQGLGRWIISGNSGVHTVGLFDSSGTRLAGASVSVNTSGATVGTIKYVLFGSPVTLTPGTYIAASGEQNAGDQWLDSNTTVTSTGVASVAFAQYRLGSGGTCAADGAFSQDAPTSAFVFPSFEY